MRIGHITVQLLLYERTNERVIMATISDASVLLEDANYIFNDKQHVLSTVMLYNNARAKEAKVKKSNTDRVYICCATNMNKAEGGCMHYINAKTVE